MENRLGKTKWNATKPQVSPLSLAAEFWTQHFFFCCFFFL
jgi:hypothetical protein